MAALTVAAAGLAGGGDAARAAPAAVERYRATDAALQATTAELALMRTRARALAGAELRANLRRQRRLEARKELLLRAGEAGRPAAERAHARLRAARRARAERRARAAVPEPPGGPAPAPSPTGGADSGVVAAIDAYLASKASPLTGAGAVFVREARAVGLDPRLLVAISGAETAFGTYGPSQAIHNPFGMGPGIVYPSWAAAIAAAARNLGGSLYLGDGRVTIAAIHERWAPVGAANDPRGLNARWPANVGHYFAEQGGDPAAPVFGPAAAPPSAPAGGGRADREPPAPRAAAPAPPPPRGALEARWAPDPAHRGPMLDAAAP